MDTVALPRPTAWASLPQSQTYTCPVPHIPEAVHTVRHRVEAVLTVWGTPRSVIEDALVVVSELVTNAVVHAAPPAALRLSLCGTEMDTVVRIEVTDAGTASWPAWPDGLRSSGEHGRGTTIVEALAARQGMSVAPGRVTRWAELAVC